MALRRASLLVACVWASPGLAQLAPSEPGIQLRSSEPELQLGRSSFALPVIDYRAPDGTWKRGSGIIVGHDVAPNATFGIGFFRMKPKFQDSAVPTLPSAGKSKKVSIGLSLRF